MPVTIPILPSSDFDRTSAFYGAIGFSERARWPGDYLIVVHPVGIELHFWANLTVEPGENATSCYVRFEKSSDVIALHDEWADGPWEAPARLHEPERTDYGLVEFAIVDPDGTAIRIGGAPDT